MHINEALLIAYRDAGATSSNLVEAEYQALVANGAIDGKWHTFLRADGWTGSLDEMMYSYLGDKGYAGTLSERLYQAAVALDLFGGYTPADEFTGGKNGWLFDGSAGQSDFLQSAGGAVAVNGDPLGSVEDLSGNGNDIAQTTGGSKPVCNIAGGIRALKGTSAKYMDVTLADPIVGERTAIYAIRIKTEFVGVVYPLLMSVSGGYDFVYHDRGGINSGFVGDNGAGVGNVTCADTGQTMFVVMKKINTAGTWTVQVSVYSASGTLIDEDTFASSGSSTITATQIGYPVANNTFWVPFHMCVEGVADTTDLLTYLVDQFGAWSPT